jgi:hypothetical protein
MDVLILEGWRVGARPQPTALLAEPINALEASEDPHAIWRTHVNQALAGSYQRAWAMLDALAFLAAPDWETVPRWRAEQEAAMVRATGRKGMDATAHSLLRPLRTTDALAIGRCITLFWLIVAAGLQETHVRRTLLVMQHKRPLHFLRPTYFS